jgi:hypothetical protein
VAVVSKLSDNCTVLPADAIHTFQGKTLPADVILTVALRGENVASTAGELDVSVTPLPMVRDPYTQNLLP